LHASELLSFLIGLRTYQHPGSVENGIAITHSNKADLLFIDV